MNGPADDGLDRERREPYGDPSPELPTRSDRGPARFGRGCGYAVANGKPGGGDDRT